MWHMREVVGTDVVICVARSAQRVLERRVGIVEHSGWITVARALRPTSGLEGYPSLFSIYAATSFLTPSLPLAHHKEFSEEIS